MAALLSAVLLLAAVPPDLPNDELARRAEEAFAEGVRLRASADKARPHFRTAAEHFEVLRQRGANNPVLHRNLGNAYLLADDLPRAILTYRRGLRLAPRDADLRANLAQARLLVAYPEESAFARPPEDTRPPWWPVLPSRGLFVLALILYFLSWAAFTRWLMRRRRRPLALALLALLGAGLLTAFLVVNERHSGTEMPGPLVVIARDEVKLRKGNGEAYPARYNTPLNRGVEARLLFEREGWIQIELSGGEVGWVRREDTVCEE